MHPELWYGPPRAIPALPIPAVGPGHCNGISRAVLTLYGEWTLVPRPAHEAGRGHKCFGGNFLFPLHPFDTPTQRPMPPGPSRPGLGRGAMCLGLCDPGALLQGWVETEVSALLRNLLPCRISGLLWCWDPRPQLPGLSRLSPRQAAVMSVTPTILASISVFVSGFRCSFFFGHAGAFLSLCL